MVGAEVDFESRLVARGLAFTRTPILQPAIWISGSDFAFLVRGNLDLGDEPRHPRFNEIDLIVSAGRSLGKVRVDVAVPFFVLIESEALDSGELVLSVSYPTRWVQLFTTHAFDIVAHEGSYFGELGVGYARAARTTLALDGSLKIGFANKKFHEVYVGGEEAGVHHAAVEAALTYSAGRMRVRPHVAFTRLLDNRGEDPLGRPDSLVGGVTISWRL